MSIAKDFYDYLDSSSSLTKKVDLFLYKAPQDTATPYTVVLRVGDGNEQGFLSDDKYSGDATIQINTYYQDNNVYSGEILAAELDALLDEQILDIGSNYITDNVVNNIGPEQDGTYYTYVKSLDFKYRGT